MLNRAPSLAMVASYRTGQIQSESQFSVGSGAFWCGFSRAGLGQWGRSASAFSAGTQRRKSQRVKPSTRQAPGKAQNARPSLASSSSPYAGPHCGHARQEANKAGRSCLDKRTLLQNLTMFFSFAKSVKTTDWSLLFFHTMLSSQWTPAVQYYYCHSFRQPPI